MKKNKVRFLTFAAVFIALSGASVSCVSPDRASLSAARPAPDGARALAARPQKAAGSTAAEAFKVDKDAGQHSPPKDGHATATQPAGPEGKPSQNRAITRPAADEQSPAVSSDGFNIWRSIGAMVFVLGGLLAVHAFIRKRMGGTMRASGQRRIKILEKLPIDARRSFVLVAVNNREILVGVGPERIEFLNDVSATENNRLQGENCDR